MSATDLHQQLSEAEQTAAAARAAIEEQTRERFRQQQEREDAWAAELLDSFRERDAALQAEEGEARREFVAALLDTPFAEAWVRARGARYAREALAHAAQNAARRLGDDRRIPDLPYRDPRLLEDIVDELERAARLAGADQEDALDQEHDDAGAPPVTAPGIDPDLLAALDHADGCPGNRIDRLEHGISCVDCPARHITPPPPPKLPPPTSQGYAHLWRTQPYKIAEQLDPADRDNPQKNPLHPNAPDEAPGFRGGRPTP